MPSIALPVSLRGQLLSGTRSPTPAFSPSSLFALSEPGIWLDPSDLTTMFQDRAGTTPVTEPGQFVGVRQDKSGNAKHAIAPTDAARMTYGIEPKTGTRNLILRTEEFDNNAAWNKGTGLTITANAIAAPDGTMTADKLVETALNVGHTMIPPSAAVAYVAGQSYTVSAYFKAGERNWVNLQLPSVPFGSAKRSWFDLTNGVLGSVASGATSVITPVGDGWYRCSLSASCVTTNTPTTAAVWAISAADAVQAYLGDGVSGAYCWGAQVEISTEPTAYQRVGSAFDVTEAGVASCHYCQYDGTDDSMSTTSIDFTLTDAMSVFAGIWKQTDASIGTLFELSVDAETNSGAFFLRAPGSVAANYTYYAGGTARVQAESPATFAAPRHNLLTGYNDISTDQIALRVNGVEVASSVSDQGTGNFGNYPLYIGRRNNTSNPFSGRDYGIIVVGKALSAGDLASTEAWLADKTPGVSL